MGSPFSPSYATGADGPGDRERVLEAGLQALDRIAVGVILLGAGSEVLHLNVVAQGIVDAADGIGMSGRRLVVNSAAPGVSRAVSACGEGRAFRVPRPSGASDYIVTVLPGGGVMSGAVFIADPLATGARPELLCQVWGLTPAEARIAMALLAGRTPGEIAVWYRVSESTVRTQIRAVFDKTGTRRQGELIKMLVSAGVPVSVRAGVGQAVTTNPDADGSAAHAILSPRI